MNRLKNATEIFFTNLADNQVIKAAVDGFRILLESVNAITSGFEGLGSSFASVVMILMSFQALKGAIKTGFDFYGKYMHEIGTDAGMNLARGQTEGFAKGTKDFKILAAASANEYVKRFNSELARLSAEAQPKDIYDFLRADPGSPTGQFVAENATKLGENYVASVKSSFADNMQQMEGPIAELERALTPPEGGAVTVEQFDKALKDFNIEMKKVGIGTDVSTTSMTRFQATTSQTGMSVRALSTGLTLISGALMLASTKFKDNGSEKMASSLAVLSKVLGVLGSSLAVANFLLPILQAKFVTLGITLTGLTGGLMAVVGAVAALFAILQRSKANSLEGRMDAAKRATEQANEAANKARDAYDALVNGWTTQNDLQAKLAGMTSGTKEFEAALVDVNTQVLELLNKFPDLAEFLQTGSLGQLEISQAGYDQVAQKSQQGMQSSARFASSLKLREDAIAIEGDKEKAFKTFDAEKSINMTLSEIKPTFDRLLNTLEKDGVDALRDALQDGAIQTEEGIAKVEEALLSYQTSLLTYGKKLTAGTEGILRAGASEDLLGSRQGDALLSIFGDRLGKATEIGADKKSVKDVKKEFGSTKELEDAFKEIIGTDIPEALKDSKDDLAQAIADARIFNKIAEDLESFAEVISTSLTKKEADWLVSTMSGPGALNQEQVQAAEGKDIQIELYRMAEAMGMTLEELANTFGLDTELALVEAVKVALAEAEELGQKFQKDLKNLGVGDQADNWSLGAQEALLDQAAMMGGEGGRAYALEFVQMMEGANVGEDVKDALTREIAGFQWDDMEQSLDMIKKLVDEGFDPDVVEKFFLSGVAGSNLLIKDIGEMSDITEKFQSNITKAQEALDNMSSDKGGTDAEKKMLVEMGMMESMFTMTEKGWALTEQAANQGMATIREGIAEQLELMLNAQGTTLENTKTLLIDLELAFQETPLTELVTDLDAVESKLIEVGSNPEMREAVEIFMGVNPGEEDWETVKAQFMDFVTMIQGSSDVLDPLQQMMGATQISDARAGAQAAGIDMNELDIFIEQLSKLDSLENHSANAVERIAAANATMNIGLGEVMDSYDEWIDLIDKSTGKLNTSTFEDAIVFDNLQKSMQKMLNASEPLSDAFWDNAENIELMKAAAEGSESALADLQAAAAEDYILNIDVDEGIDDARAKIDEFHDYVSNYDLPDLEVGSTLDNSDFIEEANNLITAAGMTSDQVSEYFKRMGYDVEFDGNEQEVTTTQRVPATRYSMTGSFDDGSLQLIPHVEFETFSDTSMVPAPTIKTLTSTGSKGGGISTKNKSKGAANKKKAAPKKAKKGGGKKPKKAAKKKEEKEKDPWVESYDWLYNLVNKTNKVLRDRNRLESDYGRLLKDNTASTGDFFKNSQRQLANLQEQKKLLEQQAKLRMQEQGDIEREFSDVSKYAKYNEAVGYVEIDWNAINKLSGTSGNQETGARIDEYIKELEAVSGKIDDVDDSLYSIQDQIDAVLAQGESAYLSFEDMVYNAVVAAYEGVIVEMQNIHDGINKANDKVMSKLQESIDESRKIRENQETEEEIQDLESQLAFLTRDTSGGNQLEIMQLEQQLEQARRNYTDQLIDDKITALQQQNDLAAEQRQLQIEIAQAQLEDAKDNGYLWHGELMSEWAQGNSTWDAIKGHVGGVDTIVEKGVDTHGNWIKGSRLEQMLKKEIGFEGMSKIAQMNWLEDTKKKMQEGLSWIMGNNKIDSSIFSNMKADLEKLRKNFVKEATGGKGSSSGGSSGGGGSKASATYGAVTRAQVRGKGLDPNSIVDTLKTGGIDSSWGNRAAIAKANSIGTYSGSSSQNIKLLKLLNAGQLKRYKKGGLADFTGPAWLDGTTTDPEAVLDAQDTRNLIELKDTLAGIKRAGGGTDLGGDNYYDIRILVDELSSDYDVEQLVDKVKKEIYEDGTYRNVKVIERLR